MSERLDEPPDGLTWREYTADLTEHIAELEERNSGEFSYLSLVRQLADRSKRIAEMEAVAQNALHWFEQIDQGSQPGGYFEAFDRLRLVLKGKAVQGD